MRGISAMLRERLLKEIDRYLCEHYIEEVPAIKKASAVEESLAEDSLAEESLAEESLAETPVFRESETVFETFTVPGKTLEPWEDAVFAAPPAPVRASASSPEILPTAAASSRSLEELLENLEETFSDMVLRLIREKDYKEVDVYRRAGLDRKLFSKLRSQKDYTPKKSTALALTIGLRLSLDEAVDLLGKAGYSLSPSSKTDVIIRYFLEQEEYDLLLINEVLVHFGEAAL